MARPISLELVPQVQHVDLGLDFNKQYSQGFLCRFITYKRLIWAYEKRLQQKLSELNPDIVITVGRYNDAKGYDYLIPAWDIVHQRHPDWILNVCGSGELYGDVVRWIIERNLEKTIFFA